MARIRAFTESHPPTTEIAAELDPFIGLRGMFEPVESVLVSRDGPE